MDLMQLAGQLMQEKFGDNVNAENLQETMGGLFGGEQGQLDLGGLVSKMLGEGGLTNIVNSWLGDGENAAISADQIANIFGEGKISDLASSLNVDPSEAKEGLSEVLPQLVDKSSSGGSLLDAVGGMDGLLGMAKKFF